jgi:three-Cys-motif partner protein
MPRKTTSTGQQYSSSTPYKLKAFRYLMSFHAGVCNLILKKTSQRYIYIDLNCGAGSQPEYEEFGDEVLGSPIIALQELNQNGIEPICHFCDVSEEALVKLKNTISELKLKCSPNYWHGENKESLLKISENLSRFQFQGLVYSDPNGKQDFPLKTIQEVFQLPQMRKVDLLMNVATTYVKRWESNPKVNWEVYPLEELISGHGKKRVFIRNPENPQQKWTFIYATNWDKQKNIPKIKLYDINSDIGEAILDNLFNPASNPLPSFNDDGKVLIQGNFFDRLGLDSEEPEV